MFYYYSHLFQLTALWFYNSNCEPAWSEPSLPTRCLQSEPQARESAYPSCLEQRLCFRTQNHLQNDPNVMRSNAFMSLWIARLALYYLVWPFAHGFWGWGHVTQPVHVDICLIRQVNLCTWPLTSTALPFEFFFQLCMIIWLVAFYSFCKMLFFSLSVRSDLWPILGSVTHQLSTDDLDSLCCVIGCVQNAVLVHSLLWRVPVLFICCYFITNININNIFDHLLILN